jgi:hypothetical protein
MASRKGAGELRLVMRLPPATRCKLNGDMLKTDITGMLEENFM